MRPSSLILGDVILCCAVNIIKIYFLHLTQGLLAFDTIITGPTEVAVGTSYNVTCTIPNNRGTFFKNNVSVTDTFINDKSEICYTTNSAKYKCYSQIIDVYYREFKLKVSTNTSEIGETDWYCSSYDGKSGNIFVNVFQPKEHHILGNKNFTESNIPVIICLAVVFVTLTIIFGCKVRKCKKIKSAPQEMVIYRNSLQDARPFSQSSFTKSRSMINIDSSSSPNLSTASKPQTNVDNIYDSISNFQSLTESATQEDPEINDAIYLEFDPLKVYSKA